MMICGVDPGVSGALAFFDPMNGSLDVEDMPTLAVLRNGKSKSHVNAAALAALMERADVVVVERVGAMPGQGVSSMFSFGRSLGIVEGVAAGLGKPIHYAAPVAWTKAMKVAGGKDGARARACELFPSAASAFSRKKDAGRADAALIAMYHFREGGQ
jgi:crossover junction endodeoxyribonuclease RuvC